MGNNCQPALQLKVQNQQIMQIQQVKQINQLYQVKQIKQVKPIYLKQSTPGSKTVLKYINPIIIDEDSFQLDETVQTFQTEIQKEINMKEYKSMEQNGQYDNNEVQQIKVKWNHFIKMKKRNYLDDYEIVKEIGRGGFGKVNKVKSKYTGLFRAAKRIRKSSLGKQEHEKLFAQMAIMQSLDHVNIARLFQVYDYKSHYVLILQICQGGELFKKILVSRGLSEKFIARVIKQILKALMYLNHMGVIHRDLKPQNMLFQKGTQLLKIIDFGIAVERTPGERLTERVGTPYYVAPEVLLKSYDEKCDIWSTGVIMYMMMTQRPPFRGENETEVMQNILSSDPVFSSQIRQKYSSQCLAFVQSLLVKNPHERVDVQTAFKSHWLQSMSVGEVIGGEEKQIIQQIQNFKFKNKLQAVVYTFLVSQMMTSDEKTNFIQIFQDLDRNHDGVISKLQFQQALKTKSNIQHSRMSLLMRVIDTNSSGYIDLTEFIVAGLKLKQFFTKEHFQQAFAYFDIDHSGTISYEQIAFFLEDPQESIENIKHIFAEVDENNDGVISREQFVHLLMRNHKIR